MVEWVKSHKILVSALTAGVLVIVVGLTFLFIPSSNSNAGLPGTILSQISGFTPYYPKSGSGPAFQLDKQNVTYNNEVLVFTLKTVNDKTVAITEQPLPATFQAATLNSNKKLDLASGKAYLNQTGNQTTAVFATSDKTLVVLNSPAPIGIDTMSDLIKSLVPVK